MSSVGQQREPLEIGEQVADVELTEKLGGDGGVYAWTGTRADGSLGVVFALDKGFGMEARDKFLTAAANASGQHIAGVVPVLAVDPIAGAYVGDLAASGTFADLPILNWDNKRRVALFTTVCEIVANLHDQATTHGWLRPENILLDGNLEPQVANCGFLDIGTMCRTDAGMVWQHRVYAPPEVRHGAPADQRADTYALGRLFHFALAGEQPDEKDERTPRLDGLLKNNPNALVRIIRKCTALDPNDRYPNAREILDDLERMARHVPVGMPHPEIDGAEESSMIDDARLRSQPPPKKKESRSSVTIDITAAPDDGIRFWSVGIAIGLGLLGLLMLGIPIVATALTGLEALPLDITFWLAAVPIGFATPGFMPNRLLARLFIALAIAALLVFTSPLDAIRASRHAGLDSPDVQERIAAVQKLMADGQNDFRGLDLTGGDLSGLDLSRAALDGSSLKNAKCVGTNFSNASMDNVDVGGADLSGANMKGTIGPFMKSLESAKCTDATTMPGGYVCREGSPIRGGN